jgi:phospholipase C
MKRYRILAIGIASVLAATAVSAGALSAGASVSASAGASQGMPGAPIKHVIEIMAENHTFDNLFGNFPGADGIPANTTMLNPNASYDSAPDVHPV